MIGRDRFLTEYVAHSRALESRALANRALDTVRRRVQHEQTGLLCEPGDWNSLASNVIRLLSEDGLALRLASNASEVSQNYRWPIVREQWLAIYSTM